jgi:uncharacterized membrane protein
MKLHARIEIERPAAEVFAFLSNFENNPRWQQGMRAARFITPPPIGPGSQYEQVARFLGRTITTRFEITDFQPGRSISIRSIESTFPIQVTRSVEPLDDGRTLVTADIRGGPGGVFRPFAPLIRRLAQRSVTADYQRLKRLLESDAAA